MEKLYYEWVVEQVDGHGDIVDTDGYATRAEAARHASEGDEIALVRWSGDDYSHERGYAYLVNGRLPETFDNGVKVPKRFHGGVKHGE